MEAKTKTIERPILFSAPMVRAILEGRKTQTRRIVKPQPPAECPVFVGYTTASTCSGDVGKFVWAESSSPLLRRPHRVRCPYGQPGDRLWVRETWGQTFTDRPGTPGGERPSQGLGKVYYRADAGSDWQWRNGDLPWRPSIHMPRWASRLTLEVTKIRVERLQSITEADAISEGIGRINDAPINTRDFTACWMDYTGSQPYWNSPIDSYHSLWESINGSGSWGLSPWVWVVEFSLLEGGA